MNKKFLLMLVLMTVLCCVAAVSAEAEITVIDKILITTEGDWTGDFFAKVENTGDSGAYLEYGGKLVAFSDDDEIIISHDYVGSYPARLYLEAGEYGYIKCAIYEDALETSTVADYRFSIKTSNYGDVYTKLPSEASFNYVGSNSYDNYVLVTFTNESTDVLYDYYITAAIYDQNGGLIFVGGDSYSAIGIHPGSTITVKLYLDDDTAAYFERNKLVPTSADSIVYIEKIEQ